MKKRPFIIDCDTGTDDAIAIVAALGCEEMEIVGITSVNGNVPESYTSRNNLNLIEYLGYHIPVCHGAILPLLGSKATEASAAIHGKTGLGSTELPEAEHSDFDPRIAAQFIYEEAVKRNGELELLVTGPITNIAVCLCEHPDLPDYIRHLYFMGGSTVGGNVNTTAEFNIWVDPEALHVVLQSGIPMTMVGLNVSNQTEMRPSEETLLRSFGKYRDEFLFLSENGTLVMYKGAEIFSTVSRCSCALSVCRFPGSKDQMEYPYLSLMSKTLPDRPCVSISQPGRQVKSQ